jgi:hypothetical protein
MVLSCCDLLAVLTNNPLIALISMSWLRGKLDGNARWPYISVSSTNIFLGFSYFALLVMNFDRYLATSYPIFHRMNGGLTGHAENCSEVTYNILA